MIEYAELEDSALQKLAADGDSYAEEELVSRYMRLVRICARPLFLQGERARTSFRRECSGCSRQ